MDQQLVRRLREEVGDVLARQRREDSVNGIMPMSSEDERQFARAVIGRVMESNARTEIAAGRTPPNITEEEGLSEGIHAALFGVGRLQPLLDDPMVENIDINGADRVFVGYADGLRGELANDLSGVGEGNQGQALARDPRLAQVILGDLLTDSQGTRSDKDR